MVGLGGELLAAEAASRRQPNTMVFGCAWAEVRALHHGRSHGCACAGGCVVRKTLNGRRSGGVCAELGARVVCVGCVRVLLVRFRIRTPRPLGGAVLARAGPALYSEENNVLI